MEAVTREQWYFTNWKVLGLIGAVSAVGVAVGVSWYLEKPKQRLRSSPPPNFPDVSTHTLAELWDYVDQLKGGDKVSAGYIVYFSIVGEEAEEFFSSDTDLFQDYERTIPLLQLRPKVEELAILAKKIHHDLEPAILVDLATLCCLLSQHAKMFNHLESALKIILESSDTTPHLCTLTKPIHRLFTNYLLPRGAKKLSPDETQRRVEKVKELWEQLITKAEAECYLLVPELLCGMPYTGVIELEGRGEFGRITQYLKMILIDILTVTAPDEAAQIGSDMEQQRETDKERLPTAYYLYFCRVYAAALFKQEKYVEAIKYYRVIFEADLVDLKRPGAGRIIMTEMDDINSGYLKRRVERILGKVVGSPSVSDGDITIVDCFEKLGKEGAAENALLDYNIAIGDNDAKMAENAVEDSNNPDDCLLT